MEVNEAIADKAEEMQLQLNAWAKENNILPPGKILVVTLNVADAPWSGTSRDGRVFILNPLDQNKLSNNCRGQYKGLFLKPAVLTQEEVQEILVRIRPGLEQDRMKEFLSKGNLPEPYNTLLLYQSTVQLVNQVLVGPLRSGKYYRFARLKDKSTQLWEVIP